MKQSFFDECGCNPDNLSDIGARFQAVASEIYSLCCNMDFVTRQSFVQSASGEYLDRHAELRDIARHSATKSSGVLTFSISEALDQDLRIPSGTICSAKDKPFIQFETTTDAVITAGTTSADANAIALECGHEYNAPIGTVTVLVNAPAMVEGVTNSTAFTGGFDEECDEALRKRLINSFKHLPTGISVQYMEESICSINGVLDCHISADDDESPHQSVTVYIKTGSTEITDSIREEIRNRLAPLDMQDITYTIQPCTAKSIDLWLGIEDTQASENQVDKYCREYISQQKIGQYLNIEELRTYLAYKIGTRYINIQSPDIKAGNVRCDSNEFITLMNTEVHIYAW